MMNLLILDIFYQITSVFLRIGECCISIPPCVEVWKPFPMFLHPSWWFLLYDFHKIANGNRRMNLNAHMDMVWHGIYSEQSAFFLFAYPEDVCVEIFFIFFSYCSLAVFRTPDNMINQTYVAHWWLWYEWFFLFGINTKYCLPDSRLGLYIPRALPPVTNASLSTAFQAVGSFLTAYFADIYTEGFATGSSPYAQISSKSKRFA